jgi:hypothetical protein
MFYSQVFGVARNFSVVTPASFLCGAPDLLSEFRVGSYSQNKSRPPHKKEAGVTKIYTSVLAEALDSNASSRPLNPLAKIKLSTDSCRDAGGFT